MGNTERVVQREMREHNRSRSLPGLYTYADWNPTENERIEFYKISKR